MSDDSVTATSNDLEVRESMVFSGKQLDTLQIQSDSEVASSKVTPKNKTRDIPAQLLMSYNSQFNRTDNLLTGMSRDSR